jgi:hypothetical protein
MGRQVLERVGLADQAPIPAYLNCLWDSNPQTCYSSRSLSGSPSKSSTAAEAVDAAVYAFPHNHSYRDALCRTRPRVPCRRLSLVTLA